MEFRGIFVDGEEESKTVRRSALRMKGKESNSDE
jgi:hypothetical protein